MPLREHDYSDCGAHCSCLDEAAGEDASVKAELGMIVAALKEEKRAILEWMESAAESWEQAEDVEAQQAGTGWRNALNGIRKCNHMGGMRTDLMVFLVEYRKLGRESPNE